MNQAQIEAAMHLLKLHQIRIETSRLPLAHPERARMERDNRNLANRLETILKNLLPAGSLD